MCPIQQEQGNKVHGKIKNKSYDGLLVGKKSTTSQLLKCEHLVSVTSKQPTPAIWTSAVGSNADMLCHDWMTLLNMRIVKKWFGWVNVGWTDQ